MAALLQGWYDCALSHGTAASAWGIASQDGLIEITVAGRNARHQPGLRVHRVDALDIRDVLLHEGIPVTAPARTLIDFAAGHSAGDIEEALNEARLLTRVTDKQLHAAMERCPFRVGVGALKAVLASERGPAITRAKSERRLKELLTAAELPWPRFNVYVHRFQVDAVWDDVRVVLEVDGYDVHGRRRKFESDRRRDQVLAAHGYLVIRVTWWQMVEEPIAVMARLAAALASRRAGFAGGQIEPITRAHDGG